MRTTWRLLTAKNYERRGFCFLNKRFIQLQTNELILSHGFTFPLPPLTWYNVRCLILFPHSFTTRMRLLRRRILDVSLTGAAAVIVSFFPFVVIYKNPGALQPSPLRYVFLIGIIVSWPFFILFFIPSMVVYFRLRNSEPEARYLTSSNVSGLTIIVFSATMGVLASSCLLVAQAIWVWTAGRVGIVWLLALVVLGMAVVIINLVSIIAVCVRAIRMKSLEEEKESNKTNTPSKLYSHPQEVTVLQIDKDMYSPQRVVAAIPKPGSELTF